MTSIEVVYAISVRMCEYPRILKMLASDAKRRATLRTKRALAPSEPGSVGRPVLPDLFLGEPIGYLHPDGTIDDTESDVGVVVMTMEVYERIRRVIAWREKSKEGDRERRRAKGIICQYQTPPITGFEVLGRLGPNRTLLPFGRISKVLGKSALKPRPQLRLIIVPQETQEGWA
jgi:hypothetical protein